MLVCVHVVSEQFHWSSTGALAKRGQHAQLWVWRTELIARSKLPQQCGVKLSLPSSRHANQTLVLLRDAKRIQIVDSASQGVVIVTHRTHDLESAPVRPRLKHFRNHGTRLHRQTTKVVRDDPKGWGLRQTKVQEDVATRSGRVAGRTQRIADRLPRWVGRGRLSDKVVVQRPCASISDPLPCWFEQSLTSTHLAQLEDGACEVDAELKREDGRSWRRHSGTHSRSQTCNHKPHVTRPSPFIPSEEQSPKR